MQGRGYVIAAASQAGRIAFAVRLGLSTLTLESRAQPVSVGSSVAVVDGRTALRVLQTQYTAGAKLQARYYTITVLTNN